VKVPSLAPGERGDARGLALDRETAFELQDPAQRLEDERVRLPVERFHHPDKIAG
jgi:hypothetical protein